MIRVAFQKNLTLCYSGGRVVMFSPFKLYGNWSSHTVRLWSYKGWQLELTWDIVIASRHSIADVATGRVILEGKQQAIHTTGIHRSGVFPGDLKTITTDSETRR